MEILAELKTAGLVKRDNDWSTIAKQLMMIKAQIKALTQLESELKEKLVFLSGGVGSFDENGYIFKPYEKKGNVDYSKIPQLFGVDLEPFRGTNVTYWKIERAF